MIEDLRLQAVARFIDLDIASDPDFLNIVELASSICNTSFAFISLLDENTQYFKVKKGFNETSMPRNGSFSTHTLEQDGVIVVENTLEDERFAHNPMVYGGPAFRFYAGAPLIDNNGLQLGALCVLDNKQNTLSQHQKTMLKILAAQVINIMELRVGLELLDIKQKLVEEQAQIIEIASIRLRSFFESSTNFQILLGKSGEIIDFNKTAFNFIKNVHKTEIKAGDILVPFIAPDFVARFIKGYNKALHGQKSFEEGSTDYGDHGIIWWEASFEPAYDAVRNIIGISYLIRNVTERKQREQKILEQNQSLLNIAHIQAHEFRGPLTTVMGLMYLIKETGYKTPDEYLDLLNQAVNNLDIKIRHVVNNIEESIVINSAIKI